MDLRVQGLYSHIGLNLYKMIKKDTMTPLK